MVSPLTEADSIIKKRSYTDVKSLSAVSCCIVLVGIVLFLSVIAGCTGKQEKAKDTQQSSGAVASATTLLATIADGDKPPRAIPGHEPDPASQDRSASFQVVFSESGNGAAYVTNKGGTFCVVHNRGRGKEYSAVGTVVLSSDGRRIAYGALADGKWRMVVDGKEGRSYDTVLSPIFSPDGQHVAYQAQEGEKWYVVVDNTSNAGTTTSYTTPEFSSDSTSIAYVETAASNSKMQLIVSDLTFGKQSVKWSIGDQLFTTNRDRTRIAAVQVVDNKFRVIDFDFAKPDVVHEGPLYDVIEQLTLSYDGMSMSYCALKGRTRLIILDNRVEPLPDGRAPELPVIRPDKKGVGVLLASQNRISLHHSFFNSKDNGKMYDEAANLTYSKDGSYAYAARIGKKWFIVVNGTEGSAFDRVVEPLFSPDGRYVVYRARKDGRRFVVAADAKDGSIIRQHPSYEQVFQPAFAAAGKAIGYGVKDGNKLVWRVEPL
jgi:hypothetical protein